MAPWIGSSPNKTTQRTDGTRTGGEVWQEAKAVPVKIRADAHDTHDEDLNDMISECLRKDGGNLNADIPMNSHKFTGVEDAAARTQFASLGQVQDSGTHYAATSSNDTITATLTPAITAYAAGQLFALKAGGTNTGAATLNLNGVGAATLRKGKTGSLALSAGDFSVGRMGLFAYDGTNMQLLNAPEFPTGTVMLFNQTSAPTGWTKNTSTGNDTAIRLTTGTVGTGGTVAFETAFASQTPAGTNSGTALTEAQMPSHKHFILSTDSSSAPPVDSTDQVSKEAVYGNNSSYNMAGNVNAADSGLTSATGSGATHTHTFTGNAINLDVAFVDVIRATKD